MLKKINRALNYPTTFSEKAKIVGGSYLAKGVVESLLLKERVMSFSNRSKLKPSTGAKTLLCRHENLNKKLISEEKFLLEDTLREYAQVHPKFTFDQYFWDSNYSFTHSTNRSFLETVLSGAYETIILGSWSPNCFWQPAVSTLEKLKKKDIKIIAIWFDSCFDNFINLIKSTIDLFDIHVLAENPLIDLGLLGEKLTSSQKKKFISPCWPFPQNFLNPNLKKTIDTVFLGRTVSYRDYREKYIHTLMKNNVPGYYFTGGQDSRLDWDDYRDIMSSAKISINFSYSVDKHQLKGRSIQSLWAKSLLLESKNKQIEVFFQDGVDYVSFENESDLIDKIRYYLANPEKYEKIVRTGHKKIVSKYNSEKYWNQILK